MTPALHTATEQPDGSVLHVGYSEVPPITVSADERRCAELSVDHACRDLDMVDRPTVRWFRPVDLAAALAGAKLSIGRDADPLALGRLEGMVEAASEGREVWLRAGRKWRDLIATTFHETHHVDWFRRYGPPATVRTHERFEAEAEAFALRLLAELDR